MKILLVTYGSAGDVRPLLALGQALHKHGLRVRVCAPPDSRQLFTEAGLDYAPLGSDVRQLMRVFADRLMDRPLAGMAPMTRLLKRELEIQFLQLPGEIAAADLILFSGLALAVPTLAEACGVPYRYAVSIPALLPSRYHAPLTVPWQHLPPLCNALLWRIAGILLNFGYRSQLNRHRHRLGLRPLKEVVTHLTANMVVAADRELAPLPPEAPADCHQTGYWHAPSRHSLPVAVERFLDRGPPPIYIGFGSMGDPRPHRTLSILRQAVRRAGLRALIQSGWAGWRFASDENCLCVTENLSHKRLFPHLAGAVHHGGAGTTLAVARAGIPQIIIPHLLDQYYWARRILVKGLGPRPIPKNRLQVGLLACAMRRMTSSATLRVNARAMSIPLQQRNGVQEAVRWLTGSMSF